MTTHAVHMTGVDYLEYGQLAVATAGQLVAAISVGADPASPSLQFKGAVPNEDALSGRDDDLFARLVVADAHFGNQSSASLVRAIHLSPFDVPAPPVFISTPAVDGSATSLTSVWLDREEGRVQVDWFGDSLALRFRRGKPPKVLVEADDRFTVPQGFAWHDAARASFSVEPGDVLVAFTDGVNECHYRHPATSVTVAHMRTMFEKAGDVETFVRLLGNAALTGIDGAPGGQDNIAIVAVQV